MPDEILNKKKFKKSGNRLRKSSSYRYRLTEPQPQLMVLYSTDTNRLTVQRTFKHFRKSFGGFGKA